MFRPTNSKVPSVGQSLPPRLPIRKQEKQQIHKHIANGNREDCDELRLEAISIDKDSHLSEAKYLLSRGKLSRQPEQKPIRPTLT